MAIKQQTDMPTIRFKAGISKIGSTILLVLPPSASAKLPSRGMVMVKGTINGSPFQSPLEPDGRGSHWLDFNKALREAIGTDVGDEVALVIAPTKAWPEPKVPADLKTALAADKRANTLWNDITPMARWDWLRWIASTGKAETRRRRIQVALSKLKAGNRRPCCFNRTVCTVPEVSKNGALLESA